MKSQTRTLYFRSIFMAWIAVAMLATVAHAQTASVETPAGPRAVGVSILHLNISNLDQSLAFYRDVLGMEVKTPPGQPRSAPALVSEPGALLRTAIMHVPGGSFEMELVEWSGIPQQPQQPHIQDPGAVMLALSVRDIDAMMAGVKKLGLQVLTKGGAPLAGERDGKRTRTVMIRDHDGFVVELVEGGPNATAASGPISHVAVYLSVQDLAQTVSFYNRAFGFNMPAPGEARPTPDRIQALFDDKTLKTMRTAQGTFPGSEFTINFQEFRGPNQKPVRHRVQDPGGPLLIVFVQEFPAVMDLIRTNGGIVGSGTSSETLAPDARTSWARDPNGLLMMVTPPRPPPGAAAPAGPAPGAPARP